MLERLSPNARTVLRVAAGIALGIAAAFGTLILAFVGAVTATGCFIKCTDDPNILGGGILLAGAVFGASLSITSVVWGFIGWNRRMLSRVAATVTGIATVVVLVFVSGF